MDISATTIALQRSGLVEPIHRETRQFAEPIWEKKHKNKRNRLSRAASSDPTPKNKIETLTGSHHPIAMITSSTETRRRMLLPHQNHSKCGTENSTRLCSSYTEKKGWHKFCIEVQLVVHCGKRHLFRTSMRQNKDKNLTKNGRNYIPRGQRNAKQSMSTPKSLQMRNRKLDKIVLYLHRKKRLAKMLQSSPVLH